VSSARDTAGILAALNNTADPYQAARVYARDLGWRVLPLRGKRPATRHGVNDATTDPTRIERLGPLWVGGIGVAMGNGLVAIDVDPKHGGTVDPSWPVTLVAATPSGGFHLFYTLSPGVTVPNSVGRLAPGVDVRSDGGYVAVPPAPGRGWGVLQEPVPLSPELVLACCDAAAPAGAAGRFVARDSVGSGERNHYLASYAGYLYRQGYDAREVAYYLHLENDAVCQPPLDGREVARVARSIGRYH